MATNLHNNTMWQMISRENIEKQTHDGHLIMTNRHIASFTIEKYLCLGHHQCLACQTKKGRVPRHHTKRALAAIVSAYIYIYIYIRFASELQSETSGSSIRSL